MSDSTARRKCHRRDPEVLCKRIHEAIDKITATFSEAELTDKVPTILKGSTSTERINFLCTSVEEVKPLIEVTLKNIQEKTDRLNEMEEKSGGDTAWRPQTGVVDTKPIKAYYLNRNKQIMKDMIEETKNRTEELQKEITQKRQSYLGKLDKAKKSVSL